MFVHMLCVWSPALKTVGWEINCADFECFVRGRANLHILGAHDASELATYKAKKTTFEIQDVWAVHVRRLLDINKLLSPDDNASCGARWLISRLAYQKQSFQELQLSYPESRCSLGFQGTLELAKNEVIMMPCKTSDVQALDMERGALIPTYYSTAVTAPYNE